MLLALAATPDNDRGPRYAEQAFGAMHQADTDRVGFQLEFGRHDRHAGLYIRCPQELAAAVEKQFTAQYPHVKQTRIGKDALDPPAGYEAFYAYLHLHPDVFPIRRHVQFEDQLERNVSDPLATLLTVVADDSSDTRCRITIDVRPARRYRRYLAQRLLNQLSTPFFRRHFFLFELYVHLARSRWLLPRLFCWPLLWLLRSDGSRGGERASRTHDREDAIDAGIDKVGRHLFDVRIGLLAFARPGAKAAARTRLRELAGAFGHFTSPKLSTFRLGSIRRAKRLPIRKRTRPFLLSDEELATLWHPATETVRAPTMATNDSRELEPPVTLPSANDADVAVLGRTAFRERNEPFGIRNNDRRRHLAMIGKTGMGKSTLLEQLILSDIEAGRGVGVIDPHGDLADAIVAHIPRNRTNDVVLFDVTDRRFPPAYNPLYCNDPERRALVVSGVVTAFKKLYGDSWGPRLEYILRNALAALMETPGATLLSLQRMLSDVRFRQSILNHVSDEIVRSFWLDEFAKKPQRLQEESISPIQNKVGQFLTDPHLRRIVGQPEARINLERVMNDGQVLIANLSKGRIGEDATSLLGSLLVTDLQQSAMHRAELQEEQRRDFYLYVDEFQNFATESFATILSEARKYRLNLTIANQYLDQIEEEGILAAVFGNVGSLLCFQLGSRDAEVLAEQLAGDVAPQDLIGLPQYSAYVRLLIDGMPSKPFSMRTIRPKRHGRPDRITAVRNASRRRYSRPSKSVQREIAIVRTFILHPNTAH